MSDFPYQLIDPNRTGKRIGLIALQTDETIEEDFRRLFPLDAAKLHITRIPSGEELTPETISRMESELSRAASLLPATNFEVIAYACTSGTTLIGAQTVAERVRTGRAAKHITDPLTAALAALNAFGARSVGIVSPYIASVAGPIREAFVAAGIDVPVSISFGEKVESHVARIDPQSIRQAAVQAARDADIECVFLSCTNLRTLGIIDALEQELGCPVISSNQALASHIAKLADLSLALDAPGALCRSTRG